jgi:hypothetical protein
MKSLALLAVTPIVLLPALAQAATLSVGPSGTYATPCQAFAAANPGDVVEIDAAGDYTGDFCQFNVDDLTIVGVGGQPTLDATGQTIGNQKAIWVIQGDTTVVENIAFVGAAVPDQNGAGIRQEGPNLTVRRCLFRDNQDGILAGDNAQSEILIEHSEFDGNGAGDGQSHNFYINHVAKLTVRYTYSHGAVVGHLAKTRALENHILYNRLSGEDAVMSYELDVPNGGLTYVIGNLLHQGSDQNNNGTILAYGEEGLSNGSDELFVVNNTFVNDRANGTFVNIAGGVSTPAVVRNNIFVGDGTQVTQGNAVIDGGCSGDPLFVNQGGYDYHLSAGSPCIDVGVAPGTGAGMSLDPVHHYVHPAEQEGRAVVGTIDVGAYELGGGVGGGSGGGGVGGSTSSSGSGGSTSSGTGGASSSGSGGSTSSGTASSSGAADPGEDEGCGCRTVGRGGPQASWLWALGALALLRRRRS